MPGSRWPVPLRKAHTTQVKAVGGREGGRLLLLLLRVAVVAAAAAAGWAVGVVQWCSSMYYSGNTGIGTVVGRGSGRAGQTEPSSRDRSKQCR